MAAPRLEQHAFEIRDERRRSAAKQNLAAGGERRNAGSDVDGRAEVVAVALEGSAVVQAHGDGRMAVVAIPDEP